MQRPTRRSGEAAQIRCEPPPAGGILDRRCRRRTWTWRWPLTDAFNRRDWDGFLALSDDDIDVGSRLVAMEGAYHGHEGLRRWWDNLLGAFSDYTIEVEELRDLGDVTLAHLRGRGHGAGSATPLIDPFWEPLKWRDGKCLWWRHYSTEQEALEALGLRNQGPLEED